MQVGGFLFSSVAVDARSGFARRRSAGDHLFGRTIANGKGVVARFHGETQAGRHCGGRRDATYKGDIHLQNGGTAGNPLTIRGKEGSSTANDLSFQAARSTALFFTKHGLCLKTSN